jgi:hypothetical protein
MNAQSVFYKKSLYSMLTFATWWTLIFWTLPFIYLWIIGQETFTSTNLLAMISGIIAMIAAIFIYVAMWIYLFARRQEPRSSKILWGIIFFLTGWYGSCAFFLTVYRRDSLAATCIPSATSEPRQLP